MMGTRLTWCWLAVAYLACGNLVQATGCGDDCAEGDRSNLLQAHAVRKADTPFVAGYCMNTLCGDYQNHGQSMVLLIAGQKESLANPMVAAVPSWLSKVPYRCLTIGGAGVGGTLVSAEALGSILKQHDFNCVNFHFEGELSGPQLGTGLALAQAVKGQGYTVVCTTLAGSYVDPEVQSWVNQNAAWIPHGSMTGALSFITAHQRGEYAGSNGLPLAEHQPSWLLKQDVLVVDARGQEKGGMLILQPVFTMQAGDLWGQEDVASRPRWLRSILATNRRHVQKHGHAMVIRWLPSKPQLQQWQQDQCGQLSKEECAKKYERENFTWEKMKMVEEYLQNSQNFSHVMILDADAALVRDHDILGKMAAELHAQHRDVFFTNEDWLLGGATRLNTGVFLARNTQWSKDLFSDTFEAHQRGPDTLKSWRIGVKDLQCTSNEQICLNDVLAAQNLSAHVILASGISYNRGGCTVEHCGEGVSDESMQEKGLQDERLEVLHFMGDHTLADKVLCDGPRDLTGEGPKGYGCSVAGSL